jgi:diguanylate cyclase (GGDEF)-like protein/PAS domain S-box-containing protein
MRLKPYFLQITAGRSLGVHASLLWLVMAMGMPFLAYLVLSVQQSFESERGHVEREMRDLAQLTTARLNDQLGDTRVLLTTLSQSVGPTLSEPHRVDALLQGLGPSLPEYIDNVTVWTRDGHRVAALHAEADPQALSMAGQPYFKEVLQTRQSASQAPLKSRLHDEFVAVFAAPTLRGAEVAGVVVVSLRLERMTGLLDPQHSLPAGAVITVMDRSSTVLARSLDAHAWIGRQISQDPDATRATLSPHGADTIQRRSFDGVSRLFGYSQAKAVPWLVFVGLPIDLAMAPAHARLTHGLMFGGAMLGVGLLLALWTGQRIARPLHQLAADAQAIGQGNLAHRSQVGGMREIGLLAGTLNGMAQSLQQRAEALLESRRLLRKVTDHVPALVSLLDRDERFRFANRAYNDWLGMEPEALIGLSLRDVYGDAAYAIVRPYFEAAWAGQRTVYERVMATVQGERWVQVTLVPRPQDDGHVSELCVMILDVTERRLAQDRLARSEERLNLAIEGPGLALFDWDIPGNRIYHSAQAAALRGAAPVAATLTPAELRQFVHPDDLDQLMKEKVRAIKGECDAYVAEYRVRSECGGWVWVRSRGRVVERDVNGRALRLAGTDADISERRATEARLRQLAEYDHLTGLPNRALFHDRLKQAVQRAVRSGKPMAVMFLDIDHFKRVNDTLGHEAGDELLKTFAGRLMDSVRKTDTVARLAGDEFTVILEELHHPDDAQAVAQQLVAAARRPVHLHASELHVTTSVGVAVWTGGEVDGTELLRRADAALYEAKRRGRDRCQLSDVWDRRTDPALPEPMSVS